MIAFIPLL